MALHLGRRLLDGSPAGLGSALVVGALGVGALVVGALGLVAPSAVRAECQGASCRVEGDEARVVVVRPTGAAELVVVRIEASVALALVDASTTAPSTAQSAAQRARDEAERALAAASSPVDGAAVRAWLEGSIADLDARLAEVGSTCGPQHFGMAGAERRRARLVAVRSALAEELAAPRPRVAVIVRALRAVESQSR